MINNKHIGEKKSLKGLQTILVRQPHSSNRCSKSFSHLSTNPKVGFVVCRLIPTGIGGSILDVDPPSLLNFFNNITPRINPFEVKGTPRAEQGFSPRIIPCSVGGVDG